ncbi:MAG TPA: hypothetical protein VF742_07720 [Terracidiphilus sp.]
MAERTHIPTSPACGQWETLLAEALDGVLRPEDESFFASHKADCPYCTALFEDARRGREWLDFLALEPEIPADLLDKILATTGPDQAAGFGILPAQLQPAAVTGGGMIQPWQMTGRRSAARGLMATLRHFTEPRILMTAAMAFFSIALTLNLTGVKLQDLRLANLRPTAVRSFMERQVAVVSTPIVRYYDHLRLVYEVQTQMKELRRSTQGNSQQQSAPGGNAPESQQTPGKKDGGSRLDLGVDPPEQSVTPADTDELQTWFDLQEGRGRAVRPGSVSSGMAGEGSTEWIA